MVVTRTVPKVQDISNYNCNFVNIIFLINLVLIKLFPVFLRYLLSGIPRGVPYRDLCRAILDQMPSTGTGNIFSHFPTSELLEFRTVFDLV